MIAPKEALIEEGEILFNIEKADLNSLENIGIIPWYTGLIVFTRNP